MPFKSTAQNAWAYTPEGTKALGGKKKLKEWESSTNYDSLPEHVSDSKPKAKVLRPGSMRRPKR